MIVRGPLPDTGYTVLQNELLRDARLSWKARGLLAYLLSQPPGWHTWLQHLTAQAPDGRDSVRAGLAELEAAGYLRRWRTQDRLGHWSWHSTVYDTPVDNIGDNPVDSPVDNCNPTSENPTSENPAV